MESITATFFDLVRSQIPEVEARMRSGGDLHNPNLQDAVEQLLSSGGKRIRPTLVILAGEMINADRDHILTLAAAIEMLHTATLVHDDLIDQSSLRRGLPTLNAQWNAGATVLTGDYIFARAANLAARTGSLPVMKGFSETLMTIVNGEINQLFAEPGLVDRETYFERIYAKTASLFELATRGVGMIAQLTEEDTYHLSRYGYCTGMAFQIVDDVLDYVASEEILGKPVASDLRQGIITLPTLIYYEAEKDDGELRALLRGEQLSDADFDRLVSRIRRSGAVDLAMEEARFIVREGLDHLNSFPASGEREALENLAGYAVHRNL
jgi:geranylgeranyl pyrophosphate synthase